MPPRDLHGPRVGYVLKMYPRFSETFIVTEVLAHEAAGADLDIVSLRPPVDGRFHDLLAAVRAPVTYLPHGPWKAGDLWELLGNASGELPIRELVHDLLAVPVDSAVQAVLLALHAKARGLDHLHAHFGSVATTVARLAGRLAGVPYSFTAHAKDIYHESVDPADLRAKLADAAAVVTVSDFNAQHLRRSFPAETGRLVRIYNGLDLTRFPYRAPVARPPLIAGVGRLVEKKGFDDLVRACALLVDRGIDFRCEIAGAGPEEPALRASIAARGLDAHVALVGPLPQQWVRRLVQSAAAFAAPCVVGADGNRDGLPTTVLEAMALGTPCVATDVTGIPEVIEHRRTGLLVSQRDPEGLADALAELLGSPGLRAALAGRARHRVETTFDAARQSAALRAVFEGRPVRELAAVG